MYRALGLSLLLASSAFAVETVRIDMGSTGAAAELRGEGFSYGADVDEGEFTKIDGGSVRIERKGDALLLNGKPVEQDTLRFRAAGAIQSGEMKVRGEVVVRKVKAGLQLVNVIPLEEYLAAVLGSEMPVSFPEEALKAQAVAARTYALQRKLETYGQPFNLGSSVLSQVYGGVSREDKKTRAAVEATAGLVLTYDLQPIEAYFHSSCGGRTETGMAALGRDLPYLASVSCPCGKLAQSKWDLELPVSELKKMFGSDVRKVQVSARTATGRATRVSGGTRTIDAVSFRERVGYNRLKSLSFEVEPSKEPDEVHIVGHGFGHGAGLCQWGAKVFADEGWDYVKILNHYYPGAELQRIY